MADTKITIPTRRLRLFFFTAAALLAVFAFTNIFLTFTPATKGNVNIEKSIGRDAAKAEGRAENLEAMRTQQENHLSRKPAEPYAWARLSFLRSVTEGDREKAFAALKMSNMVSPIEPRQMLERAIMWDRFKDLHTEDDKKEQERLWQKAFRFMSDETLAHARISRKLDEIGTAIMKDESLSSVWQDKTKGKKR